MSEQNHGGMTGHRWRFFRAGGFDQVRLDRGVDILALEELDQKLWVALSCPTRGVEFDAVTLDLIDGDKDGQIRAPEILAAIKWIGGLLKDPEILIRGGDVLELAAIDDSTPEGKQLLASAKQILTNLGKAEGGGISVAETTDTTKIFAASLFNGDGIIPAEAAGDVKGPVGRVIEDIIACMGAEMDRSGKEGVSQAKVDAFFAEAEAYAGWWAKAESAGKVILPLGEKTDGCAGMLEKVRGKVEDYFARCELAAFDGRAAGAMNREEAAYGAIAGNDLSSLSAEIAAFPLARVEAGKALKLGEGLNPAWKGALADFSREVVGPLMGEKASLTEMEWAELVAKFAGYKTWIGTKVGSGVEKLGLARVREILAGGSRKEIEGLLAKDKAVEGEANAIAGVDRLVRYHRDLHKLLVNYVNFRDFYGRKHKAIFQAGTLYLDQRSCDLCVKVGDMTKHGLMAHLSYAYLAYCELTRKGDGGETEKMTIAAAFTNGTSDNLMVGRNGIFYDRAGRDWDATIVKIVDNPISLRQAFWAPYKRFARYVGDFIAKRAAAADAAADQKLSGTAASVQAAAAAPPPPPAKTGKMDVGVVAALGVAVGGLSTAFAYFLSWLNGTPWYFIPMYVVIIILLISLPSMVLAGLKLRQRNLAPILDANGWAVNAKAKINIPFGASLTAIAKLPAGSHRDLRDPYAERHAEKKWAVVILVLAAAGWGAWYFGGVEYVAPGLLPRSGFVESRIEAKERAENMELEKAKIKREVGAATVPATLPK